MKIFYSLLGACAVAAASCLSAAPALASIEEGDYSFSSTLTVVDPSYANLLSPEFTFSISKVNPYNVTITGFIFSDYSEKAAFSGQNLLLNQYLDMSRQLAISNAAGDYPFSYNYRTDDGWKATDDIYVELSVGNDGSISCPDFTVVKYNMASNTASVVARYSDCSVTAKNSGNDGEKVSFAGNYVVTGTKWPKDAYIGEPYTFTLSIDEEAYITAFGDYPDLSELNGYGYLKGEFSTYQFKFADASAAFLELTPNMVCIGGPVSGRYTDPSLVLRKNDGKWTLSDFTLWLKQGMEYTLIYEFRTESVTKEGEETASSVFVGDHRFTGWCKLDYTTDYDNPTLLKDQSFVFSINAAEKWTAIGGYEVSPLVLALGGYNIGTVTDNRWQIVLNSFGNLIDLQPETGESIIVSGPEWTSETNAETGKTRLIPNLESRLTLTHNDDDTWSLSDYTIWSKTLETTDGGTDQDGNNSSETELVYTLLYKWYSPKEVSAIESVDAAADAPAVYYNLQGVKVANPENGIFIRVQGNKSSKVIL